MRLSRQLWSISGVVGVLCLGSPVFAATALAPNGVAGVTVTGTPISPPTIPANAIQLAPGQSIPLNAPIGQTYIIPPRPLPSNLPVVQVDPGQGYSVDGSPGTFVVEPGPNYPTIAVVDNPAAHAVSPTSAASVPSGVKSHTAIMTAYFPKSKLAGCPYSSNTGGLLDFNTWWVADNHVYSCYNPYNEKFYTPSQLDVILLNSAGDEQQELTYYDPISETSLQYGLASPDAIVAPITSTVTVVTNPTISQSDTAVSAYGGGGSFGWFTQSLTLLAARVTPSGDPTDYYPDPATPVYDEFSNYGSITGGWSGSGIWDSSGRLVAISTIANSQTGNLYGFDGGDVINFLNKVGIPYSIYNE
jgi:hypothetical protein